MTTFADAVSGVSHPHRAISAFFPEICGCKKGVQFYYEGLHVPFFCLRRRRL